MPGYRYSEEDAFNATMKALDSFYKEAQPELLPKYPTINDLPMSLHKILASAMSDALLAYEQTKIEILKRNNSNESNDTNKLKLSKEARDFLIYQSFLLDVDNLELPRSLRKLEEEEF